MTPQPKLTHAGAELRAAHAGIAFVELAALGYVWHCGLTGRRGPHLGKASGLLVGEGVALVIGHGDCPLGPLQQRVGDPTPLFELVLPPRAAKLAVPALTAVAVGGLALAGVRAR